MNGRTTILVVSTTLLIGISSAIAQTPGQPKWSAPIGTGSPVSGSPAVAPDGSAIYITAEDGRLYALDPATGLTAANWPQAGVPIGNTEGSGSSGDELICSPAVASDGTIYVTSSSEHSLYSIRPDGTVKWDFLLPALAVNSVGAVAIGSNGIVYITFDDCQDLYAFDPAITNLTWVMDLTLLFPIPDSPHFAESPPTVGADGTIYFFMNVLLEGDTKLVAVVDEGCQAAMKWAADIDIPEEGNDFHSGLVLDNNGTIYSPYNANSSALMAFNVTNGSPVTGNWPFVTPSGATINSSPAIGANGTVYVGANDGVLYALNPNGSLKWKFDTQTGQPILSSSALAADGTIVFGVSNRLWSVMDFGATGNLEWTYPDLLKQPALSASIISSPLITGSDNAIYFGCSNGNVYSVFGSAPLADSPWPMFLKDTAHTASKLPANLQRPTGWLTVQLAEPTNIYKGVTGLSFPDSGYTWFTLSRFNCAGDYSSSLLVTFFLGGDGTAFSTPYYGYMPFLAYDQLDFSATGCNQAPFPNGFNVNFQPGQTQATIGVQTIDNSNGDLQYLMFVVEPGGGYVPSPDKTTATAIVHPDPNLDN